MSGIDPEARVYLILLLVLVAAWLIGQIVTGLTPVWRVRRERSRRVKAEERAARAEDRADAAEAESARLARVLQRRTFAVPPRPDAVTAVLPKTAPAPVPGKPRVRVDMEAS